MHLQVVQQENMEIGQHPGPSMTKPVMQQNMQVQPVQDMPAGTLTQQAQQQVPVATSQVAAAWKIHASVITNLQRSKDTTLAHVERLKAINAALVQNGKLGPKIKCKPRLVEEMGMVDLREALTKSKAELLKKTPMMGAGSLLCPYKQRLLLHSVDGAVGLDNTNSPNVAVADKEELPTVIVPAAPSTMTTAAVRQVEEVLVSLESVRSLNTIENTMPDFGGPTLSIVGWGLMTVK